MQNRRLEINMASIRNELKALEDKPYECVFEYVWNAIDAHATKISISFQKPERDMGFSNTLTIKDNGDGWDFNNENITKYFLSSLKTPSKEKTIPHGHLGRGRYAFIWISESVCFLSGNKYLKLKHSTEIDKGEYNYGEKGTSVILEDLYPAFSQKINSKNFLKELVYEFGWFLKGNPEYEIDVNSVPLDVNSLIENEKCFLKKEMPEDVREALDDDFLMRIVVWKDKLSEYSKYYFLNEYGFESFKQNTGMNKKKDCFWHSVYVKTSLFDNEIVCDDEDDLTLPINTELSKIRKSIKDFAKEQLVLLRKPLLAEKAGQCVSELKKEGLFPSLPKYGIYDESSFDDLLKTVYIISPSSFIGKSEGEKKFFCATLASLLASQEDDLIPVLLEEIQSLTEEERKQLLDILKRTTLSNVVKTIKEIDHRLDVIDKLETLLFDYRKETLEVAHLQKILDDNFWIFGEQFRLFSSTEGALKKTLTNYAKEILKIKNPEISKSASGELDLFLTKTENAGEYSQKNIVVELKRPSKKLGKKEYDQIYGYMEKIQAERICNGENQSWEFYLIGDDYDNHIKNQHNNAKNYGEINRGLTCSLEDGRFKIYVRKWSDILEVEWKSKMKCLKEKLAIKAKPMPTTSQEITDSLKK